MRSAVALTALVLLCGAPARAADSTPNPTAAGALLTAKVDGAIAGATSYRIAVAGPNGFALEIREFGPERVRIASASSESIVIGTAMYYRTAGSDWKAYPVPAIKHVRKNRLFMAAPDTLLEPLPDRSDAGETLGAFRSAAVANAGIPGTMDCTYDKATFRPRACSVTLQGLSAPIQVTYAGWDDPANAVEPPPGVAPPAALPVRSPSPRGAR